MHITFPKSGSEVAQSQLFAALFVHSTPSVNSRLDRHSFTRLTMGADQSKPSDNSTQVFNNNAAPIQASYLPACLCSLL